MIQSPYLATRTIVNVMFAPPGFLRAENSWMKGVIDVCMMYKIGCMTSYVEHMGLH